MYASSLGGLSMSEIKPEAATPASPLDRRPGESEKAHAAFKLYVEAGHGRSLPGWRRSWD